MIEGTIRVHPVDDFKPNSREEEILCKCVSYEQFKELEDTVKAIKIRINELLEYLANTSGNEHLREMKVDEE